MYTNRNSISLGISTITLALLCLAEPGLLIFGIVTGWDIWLIIAVMAGAILLFPFWCFIVHAAIIVLCFIAAALYFVYSVVTGKVDRG